MSAADFRTNGRREHYVYRCYDADGQLLYVGRTNNPGRRWSEHNTNRSGAHLAVRFRVVGPLTYPVAHAMEKEALATEHPLHGQTFERAAAARHAEKVAERELLALVEQGLTPQEAWVSWSNSRRSAA